MPVVAMRARSLAPLEKTRGFEMTVVERRSLGDRGLIDSPDSGH
jgi:hypothetical protein